MKTKTIVQSAILIAMALALSYVERFIPLQLLIPLPGVKLGLANIVTLVALYAFGTKQALLIVALRCTLGSLFGGGVTGLLFSLTGGILSLCVMSLCKRLSLFSVYGVSILGAAAHSIGQIAVAMLLMQSIHIGLYLAYLLIVALFTGFATGAACAGVLRVLKSVNTSEAIS